MKKIIFAVMMLFSGFAMADRVDQINTWPVPQYCMQVAEFFNHGVVAQNSGYGRSIKQLPKEYLELLEHHQPLPHDSMWNLGWDAMNAREQEFMRSKVFDGYDAAKGLREKGVEMTPETIDKMTQVYFEKCLYDRQAELSKQRAAPKTRINYDRSSQNEKFAKPSEKTCSEIKFDTEVIVGALDEQVRQDALEAFANKSASELSPERLERILKQIKEAYAWDGPIQEWVDIQMNGCD